MKSLLLVCTLPIEYCLFTAKPEKCKAWLCENYSDLFATCYPSEVSLLEANKVNKLTESVGNVALNEDHADAEAKKHQSRGGKGILKDDAKKIEKEEQKRKVLLSTCTGIEWVLEIQGHYKDGGA